MPAGAPRAPELSQRKVGMYYTYRNPVDDVELLGKWTMGGWRCVHGRQRCRCPECGGRTYNEESKSRASDVANAAGMKRSDADVAANASAATAAAAAVPETSPADEVDTFASWYPKGSTPMCAPAQVLYIIRDWSHSTWYETAELRASWQLQTLLLI